MTDLKVDDELQDHFKYKPTTFGPPLIHTFLTDTHHELMLEDAKTIREEARSARSILVGKIEDEFLFNDALTMKWQEILKPYFMNYLQSCVHRLSFNNFTVPDYDEGIWQTIWQTITLEKIWINYQKSREHNPPHNHSGVISFVIYLDVPEEIYLEEKTDTGLTAGTIEFVTGTPNFFDKSKKDRNPRDCQRAVEYLQNYILSASFHPKAKDFLIFPAYLTHSVAPFKTDVERISVAGNWIIPDNTLAPVIEESKESNE